MSDSFPVDNFMRVLRAGTVVISALATLIFFETAFSCSIMVEDRKEEFQYDHLSNDFIFNDDIRFTDEGALAARNAARSDLGHNVDISENIYVVIPRKKPTKAKVGFFGNLDLVAVRFDVVETIKGQPRENFYFSEDSSSLALVPNPEKLMGELKEEYDDFKKLSLARHDAHNRFEYWDTQLMAKSEMAFPPQENSCAVPTTPQFIFGETYLFMGSLRRPNYWIIEPVKANSDRLVETVRSRVLENKPAKQTISIENFFGQMDYRDVVKLKACPKGVFNDDWWDPFSKFPMKHWKKYSKLKPFGPAHGTSGDSKVLDLVNFDWPGLFVHYPNALKKGVTCKGGEKYLVFGYGWSEAGYPQLNSHEYTWPKTKSNIRYAKIIRGDVVTASIKTQYALEGPERIPLETVLSWIPDSDFDPQKYPYKDVE